jgi:hypothetical protein
MLEQTARVVKAVRQAAKYYTYRDGPDRAQRLWQTRDGRTVAYADVHPELRAAAQTYAYTYRVVLSTKAVDITAEGYRAVLANRFESYYFVEHHNTDYPHAHVIAFRNQRMPKAELQALRGTMLEQERARAQGQEMQRGQPQQPERLPASDQPSRTHARDHGLG